MYVDLKNLFCTWMKSGLGIFFEFGMEITLVFIQSQQWMRNMTIALNT